MKYLHFFTCRNNQCRNEISLSKAAGLTLPLHKRKDITLTDGPLYVSNDGTVGIVKELYSDLNGISGVSGAADHFINLG